MSPHSSILVWSIPWTEKPDGLQSMELQRVRQDWSDLARTYMGLCLLSTKIILIGEWEINDLTKGLDTQTLNYQNPWSKERIRDQRKKEEKWAASWKRIYKAAVRQWNYSKISHPAMTDQRRDGALQTEWVMPGLIILVPAAQQAL